MFKRVTDIVLLPYEGSPFGLHITYNYDDKPKTTTSSSLTPLSSVTIPTSALQRPPSACVFEHKSHTSNKQRLRAVFNRDQLATMEYEFRRNSFAPRARRTEIAKRIGVEEKQVRDWFQNRRVRAKRHQEVLSHSEVKFEETRVANCCEEESNGYRKFNAPFCSLMKENDKKNGAIKEIIKFLEGCRDAEFQATTSFCPVWEVNNSDDVMPLNLLNAVPQTPHRTEHLATTDDLDDAIDILKKEAKEACGPHTSSIYKFKRKITNTCQEVPPPPPKKVKLDLVKNMQGYQKEYC